MKGCRPLTDPEIAKVKDAFVRTRDKALFILGLKTGLRISELLSLKVGDVYQHGRVGDAVYVERKHMKKKVEWRAIPLHQDAREALRVWIKELEKAGKADPSSPLFRSRKGQRAITRVQAFRVLTEVYAANGLMGKLGTHSMRKTFADRIYERLGRDLIKVQRALGHRCINSTVSYLSFREEEITEAILSI
jgi:integrase